MAQEYTGEVVPVAKEYTGDVVRIADTAADDEKKKAARGNPVGNFLGFAPETLMHYATGMVAKPVSEVAGMAAVMKNLVTGGTDDVEGFKKDVQENLTFEPKTALAKRFIASDYNPLNVVGNVVHKGSELTKDVVGGGQDATTGRGAVANALAEALPQALGFVGVTKAKPIASTVADVANTVASPVTAPVNAVGRLVRNVVDPMLPGGIDRAASRALNTAVDGNRAAVVQALTDTNSGQRGMRPSYEIVPGSKPTAAEAASGAGVAELSGMEKVAKDMRPSEYTAIDRGNEAARRDSVGTVAKTETELADAIKERAREGKFNYGMVESDIVKPNADVRLLLDRPSAKDAIKLAKSVAEEKGRVWPDVKQQMKVSDAQLIKEGFDDLLRNPEQFGIGAKQARAIGDTRTAFIEWLNKESPGWEKARLDYAGSSSPINRMQVGQELQGKLTNTLGNAERPTMFATAVDESARTIKNATGAPRYEKLEQVLTPNEVTVVKDVVRDLARAGSHDKLAAAGTTKARELVGQVVPQAPGVGVFAPRINVMRAIYNRLAGKIEGKALDRLAQSLETPQGALDLLNVAGIPASKRGAVIDALMHENVVKGGALALPSVAEQQGER